MKCTLPKLLMALGTSVEHGGQAPFDINFVLTDGSSTGDAMNATIYACDQPLPPLGPNSAEKACACSDCETACLKPDFPQPDVPVLVFG